MAETIRITLETLYDIFRNEKKREDLQKLEDTFFIDVIGYLLGEYPDHVYAETQQKLHPK